MPRRENALVRLWRPAHLFEQPPFWMYFVGFLLLLGPLVTVHELGHYLVGRWMGVKADTFSVGFGKEIAGITDKHGTRWRLSMLPLGGYVQFRGDMNPASVPDPNAVPEAGSFQSAALWRRALIVAAGPVTNLLLAIGIFAAFFAIYGNPVISGDGDSRTVGQFGEESVARDAGMQLGDTIIAIDGDAVEDFDAIRNEIILHPGREMVITVTGKRSIFRSSPSAPRKPTGSAMSVSSGASASGRRAASTSSRKSACSSRFRWQWNAAGRLPR